MSRTIYLAFTVSRLAAAGAATGLAFLVATGGCARDAAHPPHPTPLLAALPPWPHPPDWKTETIAFPLDFAPAIRHVGVEELRFAPGFFKPTAPGYFSYAFVWWLSEREPLSAATLAAELNQYFVGLCTLVGEKKFKLDPARYHVEFTSAETTLPGWEALTGQADLYDAFTNGQPLSLRLRAYQRDCPTGGHRAVLVLASPQPESAPIWTELRARADAFRCQ